MIKFFRRIRKSLLSEGKSVQYLKYAFGEVLLVVVGILLALQINTWSQNKKDSREELLILGKLKSNIQTDTSTINSNIIQIESYLDTLEVIHQEMQDESLVRFSVYLSRPLFSAVGINLETTTWENLKSTGKLNLIKNAALMDSLQTYYTQFTNVNKVWTDGFQAYNRGILAPKFFELDDFSFFPPTEEFELDEIQHLSPKEYGKDVFFRNAVRYRIGALKSIKLIFESDLNRAKKMIKMLNTEIQTK